MNALLSARKESTSPVHNVSPISRSARKHGLLPTTMLLLIALLLTLTPTTASAAPHPTIPEELLDPLPNSPASFRSELAELAVSNIILVDTRPQPIVPSFAKGHELVKRQHIEKRASSSSTASPTSSSASATTSGPTAADSASPLPSPFDSNIGANYTQPSCPNFLNGFLDDPQFKACLPFSMMLESSMSFFQASKSPFQTTRLLDHTCSVNLTTCTPYIASIAANITSSSNCGSDYAARNPTVMLAYKALVAYIPLYQASCLKASTGHYCFSDAVTNMSSPSDSYVYYLGIGEQLPSGSLTCNSCLKNTMGVFESASANRTQPVSGVYEGAAKVINSLCGPGWVNATVPAAVNTAAKGSGSVAALIVGAAAAIWLL